jgi:hypothetical protein
MEAISKARGMEVAPDLQLGLRIRATNAAHNPASGGAIDDVGHALERRSLELNQQVDYRFQAIPPKVCRVGGGDDRQRNEGH